MGRFIEVAIDENLLAFLVLLGDLNELELDGGAVLAALEVLVTGFSARAGAAKSRDADEAGSRDRAPHHCPSFDPPVPLVSGIAHVVSLRLRVARTDVCSGELIQNRSCLGHVRMRT